MKTSEFFLAIRPYFGWRQWSVVYNSWYRTWPRYTPGQQRGECMERQTYAYKQNNDISE